MTDQASICNVLLEAAEYLSKLGSNLKTRTDSLKEKRINRNKLKNTHSVHKAADKILVICELSKKSIENVESGVKNVLNFCAKNTKGTKEDQECSNTPLSKEHCQSKLHKDDYQTFTFESKKLKISRNVPIKHYMSCKVFVENMPMCMQEKYPVFYNCQLYRLRNQNNKYTKCEDVCDTNTFSDNAVQLEGYNTAKIKNGEEYPTGTILEKEKGESTSENIFLSSDGNIQKEIPNQNCSSELEIQNQNTLREKTNVTKDASSDSGGNVNIQLLPDQHTTDAESKEITGAQAVKVKSNPKTEKDKHQVSNQNSETEIEKDKIIADISLETEKDEINSESNSQNSNLKKTNECNELKNVNNQKRKRFKKIRLLNDTSSSNDDTTVTNNDNQNKLSPNNSEVNENAIEMEVKNRVENIKSFAEETFKEATVTSNDIQNKLPSSINEVNENVICRMEVKNGIENVKSFDKEELKNSNEHKNMESTVYVLDKEKTNKETAKSETEVLLNNESSQENISNINTNDKCDEPKKPLLRCVDIKKLLKQESEASKTVTSVFSADDNRGLYKTDETIKQFIRSHIVHLKTPTKLASKTKIPLPVKKITNSDETKGKGQIEIEEKVKAFKSKSCHINIVRLPNLTDHFLRLHNLKRITQNGTTVLKLNFATSDNKIKEYVNKENEDEIESQNNSDVVVSDKTQNGKKQKISRTVSTDVTKVKNALLDSDSDMVESSSSSSNKHKCVEQNPKNLLLCNNDTVENKMDKLKSSTHAHTNDTFNKTDSPICERHTKICEKNCSIFENNVDKDDTSQNLGNNINVKADDEIDVASLKDIFQENTPAKKKRRRESSGSAQLSKRKRIMESMKAKRMLLTYSSSSDTDDEQLRSALKDIKKSLLRGISSELSKKTSQERKLALKHQSSNNSSNDEIIEKSDDASNTPDVEKSEKTSYKNSDNVQIHPTLNDSYLSEKNSHKEKDSQICDLNEINMSNKEETKKTWDEKRSVCEELENDRADAELTSDKQKHIQDEGRSINLPKKNYKARKELLKTSSDDSSSDLVKKRNKKYSEVSGSGEGKSSSDEKTINKKRNRNICQELKLSSSENSNDSIDPRNCKKCDQRKSDISNKEKDSSKENSENAGKGTSSKASSISQIDGNMDDSGSDSCKMGRSKMKASGSNGESSDSRNTLDKDIDGLTNLKSLTKSRQHQESRPNDSTVGEKTKKKHNSKVTLSTIDTQQLLELESNSSEGSGSENVDSEEIPEMPNLNGGSVMDNLAKGDLLQDSDSSSSEHTEKEDKKADSVKEELDSDADSNESNVKSRRRKAHAISSDSEGESRKKTDARISDFEDSEGENSEPVKNSKRKKKATDSDASVGGSSSDSAGKKKRRRIKQVKDSDVSGSESETEGKKHGRKNIRKVMGKNQLEEATKKAAREEKERIARIAERQKLYNNLDFDESGKPDEVILEKVVLDFDPETKEPLIEVDRGLVKKLKPHQANGIKFMWDACFESVKRIKKDKGSGCILAHCMGLGKTLQVVSLTHTLLTHSKLTGVQRVLVVCPLSTVLNWVNEFRIWLKHAESEFEVDIYELSKYKQNSERAYQLQDWLENGGVCVLGYEMFRNLSADNKKFRKKMLRSFQDSLVDPGPDLVVCDEGHLLKNEKTRLSQSMNRVKTLRRIVLTGTPLQNNLKEYYCMVQFVKPNLLGKYNEYLNRFVNPITNGQYTDSTEHDIRVMKRRSHVLHKMLDGAVQRRDYGVLAPFLPPKHEYVLFITLTEIQTKLYQHYLDNYSRKPQPGKSSGFLFPDFQSLQRIWTHPLVLKYNSERYEIMQQKKREKEEEDSEGSLADFIDDDTTPEETSTEESSEEMSDISDDSRKKSKKKKSPKKSNSRTTRRGTRANPVETQEEEQPAEVIEVKDENPTEWWIKMVSDDELEDMRHSHKLVLLFNILRQCEAIGDKLLVFSQSLYSLDLIEHFLGKVDEATQDGRIDEKLCGHIGSWSPGIDYFRLDGSTSCENRSIWCKNFNREDNPRARLFLISTRAGGLGINLVAANRVVIFDVSWNPSHDVQSIFRVYRFGQKKPCYIYRFLALADDQVLLATSAHELQRMVSYMNEALERKGMKINGTMEEKIYERQVTKQAISKRVIDEQQIDRHYAENDLAELYKFEPQPIETRPTPALPKDRLFAEMLKEHERQIYKYHEHDSLLENKEEETLTEEERKAAWEDFENEKNKPPPAPFGAPWPMHNGMAQGIMAQQQQQLAYAALATVLRKSYPNMPEQDIAAMATNILYTNPQLMQKAYAQSGMLNPAMAMNPLMNTAAAMGGTSGLQYEPPWQRQQRQQQQMRLQHLMQQQNAGAKYYAGGLGSRDPVLMAMQQQQAREMLLNEARGMPTGPAALAAAVRGRPRGRPPLQPHMTPAPTGASDVVQLDSD